MFGNSESFVRDLKLTYKHAVEEANKFLHLKPTIVTDDSAQNYEDMCSSIETYLLHLLHHIIWSQLAITYVNEDATLNRKIR